MAASTAQLGNLSITTQVVPAGGQNNLPGLGTTPSWVQELSKKKKQPIKSLSAVLILIGALQLTVGASMFVSENGYLSLLSRSGIVFVGSLTFIATAIITVVFANKDTIMRIKICLISHAINVAVAAIGIILYIIQVYTDTQTCWVAVHEVDSNNNNCVPGNATASPDYNYNRYYYYRDYSEVIYTLRVSLNALVLFYIVIGFNISSFIIFLKWKSLKDTKYTLLGN
ncbi:uncharacterized protein ACNLHF_003196 [Anomaloglossus baeobatrachus]|uniref:uncharacterized protein LOC142258450 n=1 Tax=Anomaloglossus baeobatrachus TaxID=238106 RepID=UPI003F5072ED